MRILKPILTACILLCLFSASAQETYSKVKIYLPDDVSIRASMMGALDIDHFMTDQDGGIITEINQYHLSVLRSRHFKYKVLVPDVKREVDSLNAIYFQQRAQNRVAFEQPSGTIDQIIKTPASFEVKSTFGGYYSFAEMEAAMNTLVATYPAIASKTSIGKTFGNRDIWLIKISDAVATDENNEPEVLYLGLQHAREAITGASMIFFMQYLCENYASDTRVKNLVDNREIYIIPCFNPDGWEYNRTTTGAGGGWRKNRSKVDSSKSGQNWNYTYGVDLNRNWGVDWANCSAPILGSASSCGTSTPSGDTYWGKNAFSEKETKAVKDFVESHHVVAGFDQHAYGPYYSLPFGRHSLHTLSVKGQDFYNAIPALMGTYNGMRAADSYDALGYEVAGGFKDWMLIGDIGTGNKDTVWAMTGEGGAGGGTGGTYGSFWAPASQIINLSKGMCYQNIQLALAAGTYVDIQDGNNMSISATSGNLNFIIKRLGIGNDPVTITLIPLENMQTAGAPVTINSMPNYYDTVVRQISYTLNAGLVAGSRIKYIWKVEAAGNVYSDTLVRFYNPTVLLSDNMEGNFSDNWTATSNVADNWAYTNLAAYGGTKSLTESPAGNYTSSTTRTVTYKNALDLTGNTGAYLSFWAKYRAENFRDRLQVQVSTNSTNGVDGTWTAIKGSSTIQEPGTLDGATLNGQPALTGIRDYWSLQMYDLSDPAYKSGNFRFRFVFMSDGDPSSFKFERDDGFYIDNLELVKSTAPITVLPARFLSFEAMLLANRTVQLNWDAVTDDEHDHFEIEKSADGRQFQKIADGPLAAPYTFNDQHPFEGNNFYRIRQVDKNGEYSYSSIVNVKLTNSLQVLVYPNPVREVLNVSLSSSQQGAILIEVSDMQGKKMYSQTAIVDQAGLIKIDTRGWLSNVYILKCIDKNGKLLATEKLIKY